MSKHPLLKVDISQLSVAERIQLAEDLLGQHPRTARRTSFE